MFDYLKVNQSHIYIFLPEFVDNFDIQGIHAHAKYAACTQTFLINPR